MFEGVIRFNDLKEDELGLLLWSVWLEKESQMNIGMAKSYGYGRVKVDITSLKLLDRKAAYLSDSLVLSPQVKAADLETDMERFIEKYQNHAANLTGIPDITKYSPIETFFHMKDGLHIPDEKDIRYMHIGDSRKGITNEYQNRRPLETAEKVWKKTRKT